VKIVETDLPEVLVLEPRVFGDTRGFFLEAFNAAAYADAGIEALGSVGAGIVQINHSQSVRGTVRGLHFQHPHGQGKLIWVVAGAVFDVAVDVRRGSPTFGRYAAVELSSDNHHVVWIPAGFAHGFAVLSERADFLYACTDYYAPGCEHGIRWNDPAVGIDWPIDTPIISDRDRDAPLLADAPMLPEHSATRAGAAKMKRSRAAK
jgi:dTDP-4-dehydrorhamnose 3,5-epimerase